MTRNLKKNCGSPSGIEKIKMNKPLSVDEYIAAHKNHIGFYPTSSVTAAFKEELAGYNTSKGAVQFPLSKPMPLDLIKQIVKFRLKENTGFNLSGL